MQKTTELTDFTRATGLIESYSDSAAIHMLISESLDIWENIYTCVTYGSVDDLLSVPLILDECREGDLTVIRIRLPIAKAREFVSQASHGLATLENFKISFSVSRVVEGFRPRGNWSHMGVGSLHGFSSWRREWISTNKKLRDITLSDETISDVVGSLSILGQIRWSGIPLIRHPEKLCDLDEVWPSPIVLSTAKHEGAEVVVDLEDNKMNLDLARFSTSGTLYTNGMISGTIVERSGLPRILPSADCFDVRLFLDEIVFDQSSECTVTSINTVTAISLGASLHIPRHKSRPPMNVKIGAADIVESVIGAPTDRASIIAIWELGRRFRENRVPDDSERFYDATLNNSVAREALEDLGQFGAMQRGGVLTIVDPYALDTQALLAIFATALPNRLPSKLQIYTEFRRASTECEQVRSTSRAEQNRQIFYQSVKELYKHIKVPTTIFETERLHDRFMLLNQRVWHVGPSFNMLGQEVAAIVEMRDPKAKAKLRAYLEKHSLEVKWQIP